MATHLKANLCTNPFNTCSQDYYRVCVGQHVLPIQLEHIKRMVTNCQTSVYWLPGGASKGLYGLKIGVSVHFCEAPAQ